MNVNIPAYVTSQRRQRRGGRFAASGRRRRPDAQRRRERIEAIKEQFRRALAYDKVRTEASRRKACAPPPPDPRLAALVPYAKGEKPVIFHAEHRTEILDALKIADELKLKAIISGGADAWKVADALKAANVPVLVGGTLQLPTEPTDPYDAPYANPARLFEAGVTFAIRSKDGGPEQATAPRNLPYEAATAVAFGLPEAEALKAVTLAPARSSASPTRSARSRSASAPTWSSPPATSSSRRPRSRPSSSAASRSHPRAGTPGSTSAIANAWNPYGRARAKGPRNSLPRPFTVPASANGGHGPAQKGAK